MDAQMRWNQTLLLAALIFNNVVVTNFDTSSLFKPPRYNASFFFENPLLKKWKPVNFFDVFRHVETSSKIRTKYNKIAGDYENAARKTIP